MSTDLDRDDAAVERPVRSRQELLDWFRSGCKPEEQWGVGLEYERLGVFSATGEAIPYHGPHSVRALLEELAGEGWKAYREDGNPIALGRDGNFVTLEPGGQTEFSSRVHRHLGDLHDDLCRFILELNRLSAAHGISWIGLGLQPFTARDAIEWVPKKRYGVMSTHLSRTGTRAHDMMKRTAGIQVNLDFASEEDAAAKFRTMMGVAPLVIALFANSPLSEGRATGDMSTRAAIWHDTDPVRCGLLPFAFEDRPLFEAYLDWALDVPMMFVVRDGRWLPVDLPFRRYMADGHQGLEATRADWELHVTTLFPEVRLKRFVEARCADSADAGLAMTQVALFMGLVYDAEATASAWDLVRRLSWAERLQLYRDVAGHGLQARAGATSVQELAAELVAIARDGLRRRAGHATPDEAFLDPLDIILRDGESPARRILRLWESTFDRDPARLVEHLAAVNLGCYER